MKMDRCQLDQDESSHIIYLTPFYPIKFISNCSLNDYLIKRDSLSDFYRNERDGSVDIGLVTWARIMKNLVRQSKYIFLI